MKKLSSHQIRQILACVTQNRSYRELDDQLGVSKASISRIFNASVRGDKSPRKLLKLTDNELEEFFYPTSGSKFVEPDWPQIHSQLQRRGVTLQMLYEKFKAQTSRPVYTYTSFSRGYARWKADNGVRQSGGNIERISGEPWKLILPATRSSGLILMAYFTSPSCSSQRCPTVACFSPKHSTTKLNPAGSMALLMHWSTLAACLGFL